MSDEVDEPTQAEIEAWQKVNRWQRAQAHHAALAAGRYHVDVHNLKGTRFVTDYGETPFDDVAEQLGWTYVEDPENGDRTWLSGPGLRGR